MNIASIRIAAVNLVDETAKIGDIVRRTNFGLRQQVEWVAEGKVQQSASNLLRQVVAPGTDQLPGIAAIRSAAIDASDALGRVTTSLVDGWTRPEVRVRGLSDAMDAVTALRDLTLRA